MHAFTDTAGRIWKLEINVSTVRRVRGLVKVDLVGLVEDGLAPLNKLLTDAVALCDVLYAIVQPQAEERGVTDEQFGSALAGDVLGNAADEFVEELIDFFHEPQRDALRTVWTKAKEVQAKIVEQATTAIDQIDSGQLAKTLTASLTSVPGSVALSPADSPSAVSS
jgi:hypothetical protein